MQYIGLGVRTRDEVKSGTEKAIIHHDKYGLVWAVCMKRKRRVYW